MLTRACGDLYVLVCVLGSRFQFRSSSPTRAFRDTIPSAFLALSPSLFPYLRTSLRNLARYLSSFQQTHADDRRVEEGGAHRQADRQTCMTGRQTDLPVCVRACVRVCVRACVRACVRERERERERERGRQTDLHDRQADRPACVCARVRACVCACVRACVRA